MMNLTLPGQADPNIPHILSIASNFSLLEFPAAIEGCLHTPITASIYFTLAMAKNCKDFI